jgi:HEAT repeat protein
VREELSDFNIERVLGMTPALDASTARRVGALLFQIDDQTLAKLQLELQSVIRSRRIQAAQAIVNLGYQRDLWRSLITLAYDGDSQVRRTAAEVLAEIHEPDALAALELLAADSQPRVREAAQASLIAWQQHSEIELDPLQAGSAYAGI